MYFSLINGMSTDSHPHKHLILCLRALFGKVTPHITMLLFGLIYLRYFLSKYCTTKIPGCIPSNLKFSPSL
jgi:hypothetical protein